MNVYRNFVADGRKTPSQAKNRFLNTASSTSIWGVAILAAAGAMGATSPAEAARYFYSGYDGYSSPAAPIPHRRVRHHQQAKKNAEPVAKESAKPQGPPILAISIQQQKLRIYDDNGFFAEAPISTGMPGHPTPMGVFSVIEKQKLHHSNIYSGAPMPFMQRITWSGIAMHAGVLPGRPASHGCIRLPMAFAVKMYSWTKMGARVVITPGEITPPTSFSHPLLATMKVVPEPVVAEEPKPDAPAAVKTDKGADAGIKLPILEASVELRSTVGHDIGPKPITQGMAASTPWREQTHTADASSVLTGAKDPVTMSDAGPAGGNPPPRQEAAPAVRDTAPVADNEASKAAANSEAAKPEAASSEVKHDDVAASGDKPAETTATHVKTGNADKKVDEAKAAAPAADEVVKTEPAKTEITAAESVKVDESKTGEPNADGVKDTEVKTPAKAAETKADDVKAEMPKAETAKLDDKPSEKPAESVGTIAAPAVGAGVPDVKPDAKKDQTRALDVDKPAAKPAAKPAPKRTGQIAAFISRKDSKLYVRQNMAPLFDVPVTIAPSDRPLGTHVFTAEVDKEDANLLHWSVISLPASRRAEVQEERHSRKRGKMMAAVVEAKPMPVPDTPTEALDRLTIPADAMARINEALSTGGSIVVSDQGIAAGETGEGTDFILSLR